MNTEKSGGKFSYHLRVGHAMYSPKLCKKPFENKNCLSSTKVQSWQTA